jgi:hypothetical protein
MIRSKRRAKILGLCAIALGLVAFYTSASQAEKGANWMVNSKNISGTLLPEVNIKEVVMEHMALVGTNGTLKIEISCTKAEFLKAKLTAEGGVSPGNKTKFTGCTTLLNGTLSTACQPRTGKELGVVESNALKGLLILHEGAPLIKFDPVEGKTFIVFEMSEECALGAKVPVTGTSTVKDSNGKFTTEAVNHTVAQGPLSTLNFCEHAAVVTGSAVLQLTGEHAGLTWSALPA